MSLEVVVPGVVVPREVVPGVVVLSPKNNMSIFGDMSLLEWVLEGLFLKETDSRKALGFTQGLKPEGGF